MDGRFLSLSALSFCSFSCSVAPARRCSLQKTFYSSGNCLPYPEPVSGHRTFDRTSILGLACSCVSLSSPYCIHREHLSRSMLFRLHQLVVRTEYRKLSALQTHGKPAPTPQVNGRGAGYLLSLKIQKSPIRRHRTKFIALMPNDQPKFLITHATLGNAMPPLCQVKLELVKNTAGEIQ